MERRLFVAAAFVLLTVCFGTSSHAVIGSYDLSSPKDGDVDGWDLAKLIASPGPNIAEFASLFGQTYNVSTRPPNILLIIADDVGIDVTTNMYPGLITDLLDLYGLDPGDANYGKVHGTPASLPALTDRLATQGMVFSNAWAQPYCSPTRATVITGLFEDKTRVMAPNDPLRSPHRPYTFVKLLKDNGYSTAMIGKWHLAGTNGTLPKQAGFDIYRGHNAAYIPGYWSDGTNPQNNYPVHWQDITTAEGSFNTIAAGSVPPRSLPAGTTPAIPSTTYEPVVRAADTIDWINQHPDTPWFVWLAFNLSHVTVQSPNMHVPPENMLDSPTKTELNACLGATGQYGANPPVIGSCTGKQLMRAMTNAMDTAIGKVLDVIDFSNTYVIFIGDNGTPMYGNTYNPNCCGNQIDNMYITTTNRGKGSAWESGCHVPMAIRGPNIAAGGQNDAPVHVADLFATILRLADVSPPAKVKDSVGNDVNSDSWSLTPILFGSAEDTGRDPNEGYLLTETNTVNFGDRFLGARNATYKVLCPYSLSNLSNCGFYDLVEDPLEEAPITDSRKPTGCTNYRTSWGTSDPQWHFCRLWEVLNTYSILAP